MNSTSETVSSLGDQDEKAALIAKLLDARKEKLKELENKKENVRHLKRKHTEELHGEPLPVEQTPPPLKKGNHDEDSQVSTPVIATPWKSLTKPLSHLGSPMDLKEKMALMQQLTAKCAQGASSNTKCVL